MKWFLDLATRAKLLIGFGLMGVFLGAVILTAYTGIIAIQTSQRDIYHRDFSNTLDVMKLRFEEIRMRASLMGQLMVSHRIDQKAWRQGIHRQDKNVRIAENAIMRRLISRNRDDASMSKELGDLKAIQRAFSRTRDERIIPLIYAGKIAQAKALVLGVQRDRFVKMSAIVDKLTRGAVATAQVAITRSEQQAHQAVRLFVVVGLVAMLLGVIMALSLGRIIALPLKMISGVAERVAAGDLTHTVHPGERMDEIGVLTKTFHRMVEGLREMNREMQEGTMVLASSASEILAATTQVASGAAETATSVSETGTTVEEVKQTAQLSNHKAKQVSESAQRAAQVAQSGRKVMDELGEGMSRIREQMESVAESIVQLSEQSQTIGEITTTVSDLAEQSNLLAVNASIEAAKAGEHGAGFTVVAQEIRSLAEQSKQATAQVRVILSDIQKATGAAVMATEQGSKAVEAGVKQSVVAGESLRALADSIAEAAQAATQIAASSQQQLVGMDQVVLAMDNIKQASTQNMLSTKQAETSAHSLNELGQKLKQLIERYKI